MQESKGCVRAKSTSSPGDLIRNPGLMQVSAKFPPLSIDLMTDQACSYRHTTVSAAATKTEPWKIPVQTKKSNR
jgi:hypothetical protein